MDYARIASHGYAAILEFFLKDAHLSGDAFIAQAKKHLASSNYKKMSNNTFFEFKLSLYEYILSLREKPSEELITTLVEVVLEEEKIMRTAADQLRLEGKLEGRRDRDREVITNMQSQGHSPKLIKEVLQISDETYEKLSPTSANSEMLAHHMTNLGAAELIHDTNNKTVADNTIIGTVFKGNG